MGGCVLGRDLQGDIEGHDSLIVHAQFGKGDPLVEEGEREPRDDLKNAVKGVDRVKIPGESD